MRAAENKELNVVIDYLILKQLEVDHIIIIGLR